MGYEGYIVEGRCYHFVIIKRQKIMSRSPDDKQHCVDHFYSLYRRAQTKKMSVILAVMYVVPSISFQTFFGKAVKIAVDSLCYCYTSYEMTDQFYDFRFKSTATAAIGIYPTKV